MAWQRKIPFGYQIRNGELTLSSYEAAAVRQIFSLYNDSASYTQIAEAMMAQDIRYHRHTPDWNKNMVKRILENEKYLGANGYPQIIEEKEFIAVQLRKAEKNTFAPCPERIRPVREKAVCAKCGAVMARDRKSGGRACWRCQNPECKQSAYIEDEALLERIGQELTALAQTPSQLILPKPEPIQPSIQSVRVHNQLTHALNRADQSPEYMRALVLAAAEERYNDLPDPTPAHRMERLRTQLEAGWIGEDILKDLFQIAVAAVQIGQDGVVTLRLTHQTEPGKEAQAV